MTDTLWLTIDWRTADTDIPADHQERFTEMLFREMNGFDEVERVERVADSAAPAGGMGAAWLWGLLSAEVTVANAGKLAKEIQERLPGKPLKFSIKATEGGGEVSAENVRPEDLDATLAKLVAAAKALRDLPQDQA